MDSAVVQVTPHRRNQDEDPAKYYQTVGILFRQPRKTLLNNLSETPGEARDKNAFMHMLRQEGVDPQMRPQDLSIETIVKISKQIQG